MLLTIQQTHILYLPTVRIHVHFISIFKVEYGHGGGITGFLETVHRPVF
jgi:hypothetical protein